MSKEFTFNSRPVVKTGRQIKQGEKVKYFKPTITLAAVLVLALAAASVADVHPSPFFKKFTGDVLYNGNLAPLGSVVDAYTPGGVHCGSFKVSNKLDSAGVYGTMFVYGDDPYTIATDGAVYEEAISFKVNGRDAATTVITGDLLWRDQESAVVDLGVTDAIIALSLADAPLDQEGPTPSTLRFWIGVQNDGNGLDFYSTEVTSALGWTVTPAADPVYATPGETVYTYFDVSVPTWPGTDLIDQLSFQVYSHLDPTERVSGSVNATANATVHLAVVLVDPLDDRYGAADESVRFDVRFTNDGNVDDEYHIEARSAVGWDITLQPGDQSLHPGEDGVLYFQVTLPSWVVGGEVDILAYSVVSNTDPNITADGVLELTAQAPTDVWDGVGGLLPNQVDLAQNYPNPFNPTTTIAFSLPSSSKVSMSIINILGRTVDQVDMGTLSAGVHRIDYNASALASGMYFYRLQTDMGSETRKMTLLK